MKPPLPDSTAADISLSLIHPDAAGIPEIRIFQDSTGGLWMRTYNPLSPDAVNELRSLETGGKIRLQVEPLPQEDFRATEMTWLQANQAKLAASYPGQWLAIDGPNLVAHSGDLVELLEMAQKAGHPNPFITAIPAEPMVHIHM